MAKPGRVAIEITTATTGRSIRKNAEENLLLRMGDFWETDYRSESEVREEIAYKDNEQALSVFCKGLVFN